MIKDPVQSVTETLSAVSAMANMKRLLEAYRSLAPLTIGGPSSTSLETNNQSPSPLPGPWGTDCTGATSVWDSQCGGPRGVKWVGNSGSLLT